MIALSSNTAAVNRKLKSVGNRQIKFAARLAINDIAFEAKKDLGKHAQQVFDGAVSQTIKAGFVDKAPTWGNAKQISARVFLKSWLPKGVPPGRYLRPQMFGKGIHGSARDDKTSEKRLHDAMVYTKKWGNQQVLPRGWQTVVHKDYQNAKGNITKGMIQKIMSHLQAFHDPGQNRADEVKARFFVIHPHWNIKGMTPGIYERKGGRIKIVLIFVPRNSLRYKTRYDFYGTVERTVYQKYNFFFRRRYRQALASAR